VAEVLLPGSAAGRRVVQIDDEFSHRQLMRAILAPFGVELIDVDNALQAVDTVRREAPDLVLLDVSMPGMNGWQVLEALRAQRVLVPVVMISADASEGQHRPEGAIRPQAYLTKPVRMHEVLSVVHRHLGLATEALPDAVTGTGPRPSFLQSPASQRHAGLELPPEGDRVRLLELAAIGHRRGLLDEINRLAQRGAGNAAFVEHMTALVNDFQFHRIATLLQVNPHG
jgi:CheY-like chemotaxis protein